MVAETGRVVSVVMGTVVVAALVVIVVETGRAVAASVVTLSGVYIGVVVVSVVTIPGEQVLPLLTITSAMWAQVRGAVCGLSELN